MNSSEWYKEGQQLWAKHDCMNNFRKDQCVTIEKVLPHNRYLVDGVAEINGMDIARNFTTKCPVKEVKDSNPDLLSGDCILIMHKSEGETLDKAICAILEKCRHDFNRDEIKDLINILNYIRMG